MVGRRTTGRSQSAERILDEERAFTRAELVNIITFMTMLMMRVIKMVMMRVMALVVSTLFFPTEKLQLGLFKKHHQCKTLLSR